MFLLTTEEIKTPFFRWLSGEIISIKKDDKNADIVKISNLLIKKYGNKYVKFRALINDCVFEFLELFLKMNKERKEMIKKYNEMDL